MSHDEQNLWGTIADYRKNYRRCFQIFWLTSFSFLKRAEWVLVSASQICEQLRCLSSNFSCEEGTTVTTVLSMLGKGTVQSALQARSSGTQPCVRKALHGQSSPIPTHLGSCQRGRLWSKVCRSASVRQFAPIIQAQGWRGVRPDVMPNARIQELLTHPLQTSKFIQKKKETHCVKIFKVQFVESRGRLKTSIGRLRIISWMRRTWQVLKGRWADFEDRGSNKESVMHSGVDGLREVFLGYILW